jgi:surface antigen
MSRIMRRIQDLLPLLVVGVLSACASHPPGYSAWMANAPRYPGLSCAPFARSLSGIALSGDAADWWGEAASRYARDRRPMVGGVLVFRRSYRLPSGHVSVVSRVLGPRQIQVIQANWEPEVLDVDQLIVDVSPANDWSEVRVWYPPINQIGSTVYATYGFVLPDRPASQVMRAGASRRAALYATGG